MALQQKETESSFYSRSYCIISAWPVSVQLLSLLLITVDIVIIIIIIIIIICSGLPRAQNG